METLQRTANRGSVSTGYDIDNSLKIEADNSERMQRASTSIGTPTSTQKATISLWVKRTELKSSGNHFCWLGNAGATTSFIGFNDDCLRWISDVSNAGVLKSNAVFRDTSAWYHIVFAFDTTQSTASNRIKAYVNGVQITSWSTETYPNQNNVIGIYELNMSHYIGWEDAGQQSGYFAEIYLIDGQQLAPTEFGEFDSDTGIWIPKEYTGTFGNEGYHLDFENSSSLGADVSGNSNNFANLYNIAAANQATDTPTNNFATLNPLIYDINSADDESYVLTEGATKIASSKSAYAQNPATIGLNIASGGKWYFEWTATSTANGSTSEGLCGLAFDTQISAGLNSTGVYNAGYAFYAAGFGHGDGYGANVVNGLLIDLDNNKVKWYRDGTLHVTMPDDGGGSTMQTSGYAFPYIAPYGSGYTILVNFGGFTTQTISSGNSDPNGYGNFEYPTQGGYAICTKNLAEFG